MGGSQGGYHERAGDRRQSQESEGKVAPVAIADGLRLGGIIGAIGTGGSAVGEEVVKVCATNDTWGAKKKWDGVVSDVVRLRMAIAQDTASAVISSDEEGGL